MIQSSVLYTANDGAPEGVPFLVLHDRFETLDQARRQGALLGDNVLRCSIRSLRTQTAGGMGIASGFYWYVGPVDLPEPATLGDGLGQLEMAFLASADSHPEQKAGLFGKGEGGVMALLLAMLWPERCAALVLKETPLPQNLARLPISKVPLKGLRVWLVGDRQHDSELENLLSDRGAAVDWLAGSELADRI